MDEVADLLANRETVATLAYGVDDPLRDGYRLGALRVVAQRVHEAVRLAASARLGLEQVEDLLAVRVAQAAKIEHVEPSEKIVATRATPARCI